MIAPLSRCLVRIWSTSYELRLTSNISAITRYTLDLYKTLAHVAGPTMSNFVGRINQQTGQLEWVKQQEDHDYYIEISRYLVLSYSALTLLVMKFTLSWCISLLLSLMYLWRSNKHPSLIQFSFHLIHKIIYRSLYGDMLHDKDRVTLCCANQFVIPVINHVYLFIF